MIPDSYDQWRECITIKCGVPLTAEFIESRLETLKDGSSHEVKKFTDLYGEQHLRQVMDWYSRALQEVG